MINRVLIRLKVVQILYAYYQNEGKSLEAAEKELFYSLSKAYDLYHYLLLLMVEVTRFADRRIDNRRNKLRPTEEDLNPNTRFIDNAFMAQLAQNKQLEEYSNNQKRTWEDEGEFIKRLFAAIEETKAYQEYMSKDALTYEDDRELWRKLYRSLIAQNEQIDEILEEQSLYWNDDKAIVDTFVLKTIKRFEPENGADQELMPEYRDEMDTEFARKLFRNAIVGAEPYRKMIAENTKNWDMERIAFMDVLIMQVALAEMFSFPSIPVSVTLNEYVEIAKMYSTPKSASFINGMLDTIVNKLKEEGKLNKA
ncbi:MAG: transcription antitermination factor NusB [Bacteroidaceae bacterium]|nr:transcription antitermination factor NusB [Alistipes sp.]MBR5842763.1 transcription antitermination factor NusB [Bacteroidaceae bacterium]